MVSILGPTNTVCGTPFILAGGFPQWSPCLLMNWGCPCCPSHRQHVSAQGYVRAVTAYNVICFEIMLEPFLLYHLQFKIVQLVSPLIPIRSQTQAALCKQHGVLHARFISMAGGLDVEEGMAYTDRPGIDHVVNPGVLCFGSSGSNIK